MRVTHNSLGLTNLKNRLMLGKLQPQSQDHTGQDTQIRVHHRPVSSTLRSQIQHGVP